MGSTSAGIAVQASTMTPGGSDVLPVQFWVVLVLIIALASFCIYQVRFLFSKKAMQKFVAKRNLKNEVDLLQITFNADLEALKNDITDHINDEVGLTYNIRFSDNWNDLQVIMKAYEDSSVLKSKRNSVAALNARKDTYQGLSVRLTEVKSSVETNKQLLQNEKTFRSNQRSFVKMSNNIADRRTKLEGYNDDFDKISTIYTGQIIDDLRSHLDEQETYFHKIDALMKNLHESREDAMEFNRLYGEISYICDALIRVQNIYSYQYNHLENIDTNKNACIKMVEEYIDSYSTGQNNTPENVALFAHHKDLSSSYDELPSVIDNIKALDGSTVDNLEELDYFMDQVMQPVADFTNLIAEYKNAFEYGKSEQETALSRIAAMRKSFQGVLNDFDKFDLEPSEEQERSFVIIDNIVSKELRSKRDEIEQSDPYDYVAIQRIQDDLNEIYDRYEEVIAPLYEVVAEKEENKQFMFYQDELKQKIMETMLHSNAKITF